MTKRPATPDTEPLSLQPQLDEITAHTRSLVQPERLKVMDDFIAGLLSSGAEGRVLPIGAAAPSFALQDATTGKLVRSSDLLALGPLVINFFRGRWCPYCMTELEAWQHIYPELRERGALLVGISPQLQRQNDFTAQQHNITFPLLTDKGCSVAEQFGLTYTVPEPMQQHFRSVLVNVPFINGDPSWRLPLPATFVINREGIITYSAAYADYRVRPEPGEVLAALSATITTAMEASVGSSDQKL